MSIQESAKVLFLEPGSIDRKSENAPMGPIEEAMRLRIETLKGTKYPDNFDWSVYDRIAKRFGDNQPRGGVVFKTTFKLVNHHSSCTKCHYAFEIDSYGRGCVHNCQYCYAKEQLSNHGYWNKPVPFPVDISEIRKILYTVFETDKPSRWRPIMEKKVPVRIGSMSDSFMWIDKRYGVTRELLKILNFYDYPYIIFTRSDLIAEDEYLKLLRKDLCSVQMSICGNNENLTRLIEPGAPSIFRRLKALKTVSNSGVWTTVRINPLFPIFPDGYFTDPDRIASVFGARELAPRFELFDPSLFDQIFEAGVPSVLAGFVRLSNHAIKAVSESTGIDLSTFFLENPSNKNSDRRYSDKEIHAYYRWLRNESTSRGLRFSTCYIGNGIKDYYQYQTMWSNKSDCCDAVGNIPTFQSSSQDIPWTERVRHTTHTEQAAKARQQDEETEAFYVD